MKPRTRIVGMLAALFILAMTLGFLRHAELFAKKEFFEAARKKYGKQIKGCKHCHVKLLPSEESHQLNPRGLWLLERKNKRDAETVDITWLEEYREAEPQVP